MGQTLEVLPGRRLRIAAITRGIRSFTLAPYLFAEIGTARRMIGLRGDESHYWVLDLEDPSCAGEVVREIERHPEVRAMRTDDFQRQTETVWVEGAGIGAALFLAAALGLVVAAVVLSQTLYSIVSENLRELGTLKALGATRAEIVQFVLWQAALLGGLGGAGGALLALALAQAAERFLAIRITGPLLLAAACVDVVLCTAASIGAVRKVVRLEPAEVFR